MLSASAEKRDLALAVTQSCWAHFETWAAWPELEVTVDADVTYSLCRVPHGLFNQAYGARFTTATAESRIAAITTQACERGVPLLWRVGPDSRPADLGDRLLQSGFIHVDRAAGMAVNLDEIEAPACADYVTLRPVRSLADLELWNDIGAEGFEMPGFAAASCLAMHATLGLGSDSSHWPYLAELDNEPVAMAALTLFAGVACLQTLATRAQARNRGLGTALTSHIMAEGRRRGFEVGVLQASALGHSVYEKLGFREVCHIDEYLLEPDAGMMRVD